MMSHHLMRCLMAGVILYLFSMEWVAFTRKAAPGGIIWCGEGKAIRGDDLPQHVLP